MATGKRDNTHILALVFCCLILLLAACAKRSAVLPPDEPKVYKKEVPQREIPPKEVPRKEVPRMGYTIQAGAFSDVNNAARFTEALRRFDLDATYFAARTGLYKVRFGNFPTKEAARERAEALKSQGIIEAFYIVKPEEYAVSKMQMYGTAYLRNSIMKTAESFIGIPYLWGGSSVDTGFDCSGLTMTIYQINGLDLPRTSAEQYETGDPVNRHELQRGDLVFFANGGSKIDHVGIYIGDDRFIHAPSRGKKVRIDSLSRQYFHLNYRGGRSYL